MKQLYDYLTESFDAMLKLSDEDKNKLIELDSKFNDLADEYEKEHIHFANVTNSDEVVENILKAIKEKNLFNNFVNTINIKFCQITAKIDKL